MSTADIFGFGELEIRGRQCDDLRRGVSIVKAHLEQVASAVAEILPGHHRPQVVIKWQSILETIQQQLAGANAGDPSSRESLANDVMDETWRRLAASLVRLAAQQQLAHLYAEHEELRLKAHAPEFAESVVARIRDLAGVLRWTEIRSAQSLPLPQVTDYVSLGAAATWKRESGREPGDMDSGADYDEKFGLLRAPRLFCTDLSASRQSCGSRARSVSVAYVDIDRFKDVNSRYSEAVVDQDILPFFMRAVEAFFFARGRAYREGGDEYLVLLPNFGSGEAMNLLNAFREFLDTVRYPPGVAEKLRVSIGVYCIPVDSAATCQQVKQIANLAKNRAKQVRDSVVLATDDDAARVLAFDAIDEDSGTTLP